jgi:hypothetical protein
MARHHGGLLLAGGQGDDLEHLLLDPASLIDDGQGVVEALQPLGDGRQDLEARPPGRDDQLVGVDLDAGVQLRVELHHPGGRPEAQPGLALVGGDDHDLGALDPGQQLVQRQHRRQARLALATGQHPPGQPGPGPLIPGRGDQLPLPGSDPQRLADTVTPGDPHVVEGEPCHCQLAPSGAAQRQRRGVDVGLGAGPHATTGAGSPLVGSVIACSAGDGSLAMYLLRTRAATWARWADLALLHERQRTTRRPPGRPPAATSLTWSAVRSALGWAGWRAHPGHQSPSRARWSATTRRLRSRSRASLWRSGRRTRLAWSMRAWQSLHLGLPRTALPQSRQGRVRVRVIVACACGGAGLPWPWLPWRSPGSGHQVRRTRRGRRGSGLGRDPRRR